MPMSETTCRVVGELKSGTQWLLIYTPPRDEGRQADRTDKYVGALGVHLAEVLCRQTGAGGLEGWMLEARNGVSSREVQIDFSVLLSWVDSPRQASWLGLARHSRAWDVVLGRNEQILVSSGCVSDSNDWLPSIFHHGLHSTTFSKPKCHRPHSFGRVRSRVDLSVDEHPGHNSPVSEPKGVQATMLIDQYLEQNIRSIPTPAPDPQAPESWDVSPISTSQGLTWMLTVSNLRNILRAGILKEILEVRTGSNAAQDEPEQIPKGMIGDFLAMGVKTSTRAKATARHEIEEPEIQPPEFLGDPGKLPKCCF
ncbi:uncharacterized protein PG986_008425 [Apiospora aurea]|uniref:Uncharacterized protein n=1 Tax=Apiospora aurea TaxID=335848 RepID=A0ABR1QFP9_9PEZI